MEIRIAEENELKDVFALRVEVFVDEQKVPPELELDDEDAHALHFIAVDDGIAVGCARVILADGEAHVGRLAVKRDRRGEGIGAAVCRYVIECVHERGFRHVWLNAQLSAVGFYEKLGFKREGENFIEAGIEHVRMAIELE